MLNDLVIVNLRANSTDEMPAGLTNLQWQTCLRRIVFLRRSELEPRISSGKPGLEIYSGRKAYQFLLEVICGLHSPLVGENAVMGQFRQFRTSAVFPDTAWGKFLSSLTTDLLVDARQVRHHHLQNLGSQSYGSLIRKHLKGQTSVAVLGAGSLAREIIPWLTEARVFFRNWQHARELQDEHPHIQMDQFQMADAGWKSEITSLIVAAPLSAVQISEWLAVQKVSFSMILDLRGNAGTDQIRATLPVIELSQLLASLHDERERIADRVISAREEINALALRRSLAETSSIPADCRSQIQKRSAVRGSFPSSEYSGLVSLLRDCLRRGRPAPSRHSVTSLGTLKAIA
jgi:glutamyl-tRNA reductase